MGLILYKPNKNSKGGLVNINFSAKTDKFVDKKLNKGDKSVYFSFVLQVGWDEKNEVASFKNGKKCSVKFSPTEIGGMLYALEHNVTLADALGTKLVYHDGGDKSNTTIYFGPAFKKKQVGDKWVDTEERRGFSIRAIRNDKTNNTKDQFSIGFNFAECKLLQEYLKDSLTHIFGALHGEDIARMKYLNENKKQPEVESETPPNEEVIETKIEDEDWG